MTTLAQYKFLGTDQETRMGVAKVLIEVSPWLRVLPFVQLANNNISRYKMETSDGGASVHSVDDTWSVVNPTWEFREAALAILGDNISTDNFGELASGPENAMAVNIELKTKGVGQKFDQLAVYGQTTSTGFLAQTKNFKGLAPSGAKGVKDILFSSLFIITSLRSWHLTGLRRLSYW